MKCRQSDRFPAGLVKSEAIAPDHDRGRSAL